MVSLVSELAFQSSISIGLKSESRLRLNVKSGLLAQFIKRRFASDNYLMCPQYIFTIDKINGDDQ